MFGGIFILIAEQIQKVISHSQKIDVSKEYCEDLVKKWEFAKADFIYSFGDSIYEYPKEIELEVDDEVKYSEYKYFKDCISRVCPELEDFLNSYSYVDFYSNKLFRSYEKDDIKIPEGMKFIKAFKFFINDRVLLEDIQGRASRLIQNAKITGIFCLSVHPLDYLSISENNNGWRSCHALNGDYRAGNLEYMLDRSTIVCYIKCKGGDVILDNFGEEVPWNNKKWRMLLYLDEKREFLIAGRQYPNSYSEILNWMVGERVLDMLPYMTKTPARWSSWNNSYIVSFGDWSLTDKYLYHNFRIYGIKQIIETPSPYLHYNDVLFSSQYEPPYISRQIAKRHGIPPKIFVGAEVPCPSCNGRLDIPDVMMCSNCYSPEPVATCMSCGINIYYDEDVYFVPYTDDAYCPDCFEKVTSPCNCCGERFYTEDMIYDEVNDVCYCTDCF